MAEYENYEPQEESEPKKKGGVLGKVVALLLGFILGIIATIGGIAGAGFYIYKNVKIKTALSWIPGDFNYSEYITEDYAEKTIEGLIGGINDIIKDAGGVGENSTLSLSSFLSVSPYPEKAAKELKTELAKYGVDIDDQKFLSVPFVQFSKYLQDTVNDIRLGAVLSAANVQMNELLMYICYGEEGVDYTLVDGKPQMIEGKEELRLKELLQAENGFMGIFNDVPLHVLLEIDFNDLKEDDPLMVAICYGSDTIHYTNVNVDGRLVPTMHEIIYTATHETVVVEPQPDDDDTGAQAMEADVDDGTGTQTEIVHTLFDEFGREIKDATYNDETGVFEISDDKKTLYAVHDSTLAANQYRVYDTLEGNPTPLKFKKRTVEDLIGNASNLVMDLRIRDLFKDTASSQMLTAIENWTILELTENEKMEGLKIGDIIPIDVEDEDTSKIMKTLKDYTIGDLKKKETIEGLKIGDLIVVEETTGIMAQLKNWEIGELNKNKFESLTVMEIMGDTGDSGILAALANKPISALKEQDTIDNLTLYDVMPSINTDENTPHILERLAENPATGEPTTIRELPDRMHTLTLNDVLAEDSDNSSDIISKLGNTPVEQLANKLAKLSIQELYSKDVFERENKQTGNYIVKNGGASVPVDRLGFYIHEQNVDDEIHYHFIHYSKPLSEIIDEIKENDPSFADLTEETFNHEAAYYELYAKQYEVTLQLHGVWKYLLHPKGHPDVEDHAFMISDFEELVENMTDNVKAASLNDMNKDFDIGISENLLDKDLDVDVVNKANETTTQIGVGKTKIGHLSIKELTVYIEVALNNPTLLL